MTPHDVALITVAAIGAIGAVVAAFLAGFNNRKLDVIHFLVNANLRRVEKALAKATRELADIRAAHRVTRRRAPVRAPVKRKA